MRKSKSLVIDIAKLFVILHGMLCPLPFPPLQPLTLFDDSRRQQLAVCQHIKKSGVITSANHKFQNVSLFISLTFFFKKQIVPILRSPRFWFLLYILNCHTFSTQFLFEDKFLGPSLIYVLRSQIFTSWYPIGSYGPMKSLSSSPSYYYYYYQ